MEHLYEVLVFSGKALVIVIGILVVLAALAGLIAKAKPPKEELKVEDYNLKLQEYGDFIKHAVHGPKALKAELKRRKKKEKKEKKKSKSQIDSRIFVISFEGDIRAHQVSNLREEVTAIIGEADPDHDEVVALIESPGGMVHGYGLAASQLARFRDHKIKLTVCVDKVAASGGYMMACVGDKILAAPFAIMGSIGVMAQMPNFNKLLKKNDIDYQEFTAGEYKRTVSLLGEVTDKGKEKFKEQIEDTHKLFKEFVKKFRPQLDIDKVATGEYWFGWRAKELGLVDELKTSDEYLLAKKESAQILKVSIKTRPKMSEKLANAFGRAVEKSLDRITHRL